MLENRLREYEKRLLTQFWHNETMIPKADLLNRERIACKVALACSDYFVVANAMQKQELIELLQQYFYFYLGGINRIKDHYQLCDHQKKALFIQLMERKSGCSLKENCKLTLYLTPGDIHLNEWPIYYNPHQLVKKQPYPWSLKAAGIITVASTAIGIGELKAILQMQNNHWAQLTVASLLTLAGGVHLYRQFHQETVEKNKCLTYRRYVNKRI